MVKRVQLRSFVRWPKTGIRRPYSDIMDPEKMQTNPGQSSENERPPDGKRKQGQTSGEQGKQRGQKRPKAEGNRAKGGEDKGGMESAPGGKNLQTYVQILGTDTGDTCPSVMVFSQNCRYLFNVGDGLQVCMFHCQGPIPVSCKSERCMLP